LGGALVAPEVLLSITDGFRIDGASRLEGRAKEIGLTCVRKQVDLDACRIAEGALELLRVLRRVDLLGLIPSAAPRNVLLYARPDRDADLASRLVPLRASRLLLASLEDADPKRVESRGRLPNSVRFRV
jgi:hypothetical protein